MQTHLDKGKIRTWTTIEELEHQRMLYYENMIQDIHNYQRNVMDCIKSYKNTVKEIDEKIRHLKMSKEKK